MFLDLAKAFDTVSHVILLHKIGVRGPALNIFKNYLNDRRQRTKLDDILSDYETINMGVPQSTILGPILFLIHIYDIASIQNFTGHMISYADDTATFSLMIHGINYMGRF